VRKWIATGLNFFFLGLGYLVLGHKKVQSVLILNTAFAYDDTW